MILLDGVFHEGRVAPFDLGDRGLTLGDGVFETMLVLGGVPHRLGDHLDRMEQGLAVLGFTLPRERLSGDIATLASRAPGAGAVLRLTVTRGVGARGLAPPERPEPTVIVALAPFDPALMFQPVRLAVSSIRRNDLSPLSRIKSLNYLDNVLALREARANGADDALLLNTGGRVASAAAANVFRIMGDRLETPPVADGVLAGVIRARILALAGGAGLVASERSLGVEDLREADGVFLTNSVRLLQPVTAMDGEPIRVAAEAMNALRSVLVAEIAGETGTRPGG